MPLHMDTTVNGRRWKPLVLLAWCLLLMLVWGLWLWRLDASDLTFDEAATYVVAHRPLLDILDRLRVAVREHPPVYYLLIHGWMALVGTSEFSLRAFSVCAGLVALVLAGWLARLTYLKTGRFAGAASLLTAALLAVVPGMAYYARDARMYSLGAVWTLLSMGLFLRDWLFAEKWPRRIALVSLATVHFLAAFTHYYLLLPILVQPLVLLVTRRWRPLLAWCAAHGLLALAGLGWLWLAPGLQMTTEGLGQHLSFALPDPSQVFYLLGKILFSPVVLVHLPLLYSLLALAAAGVFFTLWRCRAVGVWLALALLVPLALAYTLPQPPAPRYLVFLTPPVALALALFCVAPLDLVKHRWPAWGVTLGLALVAVWLLVAGGLYIALAFDRSRYGHTVETVKAHAAPGDGVLFYGPWQWIQFFYYDPGGLPPITNLPPRAPPRLKPDEAEPVLEELLARYDRLWVLPAAVDDVDPPHYVAGWLETHAHQVWETRDFSLYLPSLPLDAPARAVGVAFGQALRLERVAWEPGPVPAGEPLRLALTWSPLRRLENDVRLALTLADQEGHVWDVAHPLPGEWSSPPSTWLPGQVIADYEGLMVPQGAPPGEYVVRLMVGDEVTGEPLLVEGEKEIDLLAIQVVEPIRAPVLLGLPNPEEAAFCSPDGTTCLSLAGYRPGGLRVQQGSAVPFSLYWLVPGAISPEIELCLRVQHRSWLPGLQANSIVTRTFALAPIYSTAAPELLPDESPGPFQVMLPLVMRAFPLALDDLPVACPPGRLVKLPLALELPPDAPTGLARVTLEVLGPDGSPWPTTGGDLAFSLFNITVDERPVLRRLPASLTPVQVDFGTEVGLRGYRVEGSPRPGDQLQLTYAWYARARPTAIYAVFNHLMTADGALAAQADGWPQEGRMLTTQWQAGEYIEDSYTLVIPSDAPPGPYTLYVGLYDAATGDRQPAFQDGHRLPGDRVPIPLPGEGGP
jgi:mannosyltransferase